MNTWLLKTEPSTFSWQTLNSLPGKISQWEGVRNYQARNFIREMKKGDLALFYHSVVSPQIIPGIVQIVKEPYADYFSWDPKSKYFDPKSSPENPRWQMVDVKAYLEIKQPISREELKEIPELADMELLRKGSRLSVMPVEKKHFQRILKIRGIKLNGH
ncbi:MAG: EVE domain-containing protein [Leptospiraceae bacterium]|nr:EVE domain-containing protein [Leptospiraceae bacterium]